MSGDNNNFGWGKIFALGAVAVAGGALAAYLASDLGDPVGEQSHQNRRRQEPTRPKRKQYEILIVGKSGVGKTSLMHRYSDERFEPRAGMTLGVDTNITKKNIFGENVTVVVQDAAGLEQFRPYVANYYKTAQGIIFVYDVTDKSSLKEMESLFENLEQNINVRKIVIGNKTDLLEKREVKKEEGEACAERIGAEYYETSAQDEEDTTIVLVFERLTLEIMDHPECWAVE